MLVFLGSHFFTPGVFLFNTIINYSIQIWQKDGLDLCLIPYGCVATGPNSGVIEVVKDAKTVANVKNATCTNKTIYSCT